MKKNNNAGCCSDELPSEELTPNEIHKNKNGLRVKGQVTLRGKRNNKVIIIPEDRYTYTATGSGNIGQNDPIELYGSSTSTEMSSTIKSLFGDIIRSLISRSVPKNETHDVSSESHDALTNEDKTTEETTINEINEIASISAPQQTVLKTHQKKIKNKFTKFTTCFASHKSESNRHILIEDSDMMAEVKVDGVIINTDEEFVEPTAIIEDDLNTAITLVEKVYENRGDTKLAKEKIQKKAQKDKFKPKKVVAKSFQPVIFTIDSKNLSYEKENKVNATNCSNSYMSNQSTVLYNSGNIPMIYQNYNNIYQTISTPLRHCEKVHICRDHNVSHMKSYTNCKLSYSTFLNFSPVLCKKDSPPFIASSSKCCHRNKTIKDNFCEENNRDGYSSGYFNYSTNLKSLTKCLDRLKIMKNSCDETIGKKESPVKCNKQTHITTIRASNAELTTHYDIEPLCPEIKNESLIKEQRSCSDPSKKYNLINISSFKDIPSIKCESRQTSVSKPCQKRQDSVHFESSIKEALQCKSNDLMKEDTSIPVICLKMSPEPTSPCNRPTPSFEKHKSCQEQSNKSDLIDKGLVKDIPSIKCENIKPQDHLDLEISNKMSVKYRSNDSIILDGALPLVCSKTSQEPIISCIKNDQFFIEARKSYSEENNPSLKCASKKSNSSCIQRENENIQNSLKLECSTKVIVQSEPNETNLSLYSQNSISKIPSINKHDLFIEKDKGFSEKNKTPKINDDELIPSLCSKKCSKKINKSQIKDEEPIPSMSATKISDIQEHISQCNNVYLPQTANLNRVSIAQEISIKSQQNSLIPITVVNAVNVELCLNEYQQNQMEQKMEPKKESICHSIIHPHQGISKICDEKTTTQVCTENISGVPNGVTVDATVEVIVNSDSKKFKSMGSSSLRDTSLQISDIIQETIPRLNHHHSSDIVINEIRQNDFRSQSIKSPKISKFISNNETIPIVGKNGSIHLGNSLDDSIHVKFAASTQETIPKVISTRKNSNTTDINYIPEIVKCHNGGPDVGSKYDDENYTVSIKQLITIKLGENHSKGICLNEVISINQPSQTLSKVTPKIVQVNEECDGNLFQKQSNFINVDSSHNIDVGQHSRACRDQRSNSQRGKEHLFSRTVNYDNHKSTEKQHRGLQKGTFASGKEHSFQDTEDEIDEIEDESVIVTFEDYPKETITDQVPLIRNSTIDRIVSPTDYESSRNNVADQNNYYKINVKTRLSFRTKDGYIQEPFVDTEIVTVDTEQNMCLENVLNNVPIVMSQYPKSNKKYFNKQLRSYFAFLNKCDKQQYDIEESSKCPYQGLPMRTSGKIIPYRYFTNACSCKSLKRSKGSSISIQMPREECRKNKDSDINVNNQDIILHPENQTFNDIQLHFEDGNFGSDKIQISDEIISPRSSNLNSTANNCLYNTNPRFNICYKSEISENFKDDIVCCYIPQTAPNNPKLFDPIKCYQISTYNPTFSRRRKERLPRISFLGINRCSSKPLSDNKSEIAQRTQSKSLNRIFEHSTVPSKIGREKNQSVVRSQTKTTFSKETAPMINYFTAVKSHSKTVEFDEITENDANEIQGSINSSIHQGTQLSRPTTKYYTSQPSKNSGFSKSRTMTGLTTNYFTALSDKSPNLSNNRTMTGITTNYYTAQSPTISTVSPNKNIGTIASTYDNQLSPTKKSRGFSFQNQTDQKNNDEKRQMFPFTSGISINPSIITTAYYTAKDPSEATVYQYDNLNKEQDRKINRLVSQSSGIISLMTTAFFTAISPSDSTIDDYIEYKNLPDDNL